MKINHRARLEGKDVEKYKSSFFFSFSTKNSPVVLRREQVGKYSFAALKLYIVFHLKHKREFEKSEKRSSRFWSRKEIMPNYCWCSVFTGVLSSSPWWEIPSFNLIQCSRMSVSNFLPGVLFFCFSNHSEATGIKTLQVMAYGWNRISLHSISGSGVLEGCWQPCASKHWAEQGPASAVCCGLVFLLPYFPTKFAFL